MWHNEYDGYSPRGGVLGPGLTPVVRLLLYITVGVFLAQIIFDQLLRGQFTLVLALSRAGLRHGYYWQLLTYMFLHGGFFHLFLNMLALYFLGPPTERTLGSAHFLVLYLASGILGGLGWILLETFGLCVGASGAVFGLLAAFATLYPREPITLLLFFVLPITMEAWLLVVVASIVQVLFLITGAGGRIAYAVHVAGALVGFLYVLLTVPRRFHLRPRRLPFARPKDAAPSEPRWLADDRVDQLLDKVAAEGIHSLTAFERSLLERAARERRSRGH
ncbi:MAG: rhomboid family intramembrane serine protease [Candidatus Marinimicrobia bacterium]|nr:rhomboid family intramembrane serine protease [Candidatus Neomarinimicrobiota bacterium]